MSEKTSEKSKVKFVCGIATTILLVAVAALLLYMIIVGATGNIPFLFGNAPVRITTGSMETQIPAGSYIMVRKADVSKLEVGDVIVFRSDDPALSENLNTHRIKEIATDEEGKRVFTTKGDNNTQEDRYKVGEDKVEAVYVKNLPVITAIVRFIMNKFVFALLIVVPCLAFLTMYIRDIAKKSKKLKEEEKEKLITAEIERLKKSGYDGNDTDIPSDNNKDNKNH